MRNPQKKKKLIRTVRMTFKPASVVEFIELFENSKKKIREFPGCHHLELHQDYHDPNIFATYSIWSDERSLENYRKSDLFKDVWSRTRLLFQGPPIAFSGRLFDEVEGEEGS